MSKAALDHFTKSLALELGEFKVRANAVKFVNLEIMIKIVNNNFQF